MAIKKSVFTPEVFRFFRELGRNNKKVWMDANRERYRTVVVEPFRKLLDELAPFVLELDARLTPPAARVPTSPASIAISAEKEKPHR